MEWCTHAYNLSYGTAQRRRAVFQGKVVIQLDKNGAFIKRHLTLMDACRDTGINFQNISQCCNNKRKTAGGFVGNLRNSRKYKEIKNLFSYDRNKKNRNQVCDI